MRAPVRNWSVATTVVMLLALGGSSAWGAGFSDFELTKAVPADAALVAHSRNHPGRDFINAQYDRVWEAIERARLDSEFKRLMRAINEEGGGDVEAFERTWLTFSEILSGVDWESLGAQEMVYAMKMGLPAEFIFVMRPADGTVGDNYQGLSEALRSMCDMSEDWEFSETGEGERRASQAELRGPMPITFTVARRGDVIVMGFGMMLVEQSLALLDGEIEGSLAQTERFKAAFADLPAPTDEYFYCDFDRMMTQFRRVLDTVMESMKQAGVATEDSGPARVVRIIDALDMFDYVASTATTNGKKRTSQTLFVLKENAKSKPFYEAFFGNPPIEAPLARVPAEAANVSVSSGIDFLELYQALKRFAARELPEVSEGFAEIETVAAANGLDLEQDVLGWIRGDMISFSIPGPTAFSSGEWAVLVGISDEERARTQITSLVDNITPMMEENGGRISRAEREDMLAFLVEPPFVSAFGIRLTLAVGDEHLYVASSMSVIEKSRRASAAGKTFAENPRFKAEGLAVNGPVVGLAFSDNTNVGEQWGQILEMAPMFATFGGSEMQTPTMLAVLRLVRALGPVAREFNFYLSTCEQSTFDGRRLRIETVNNYREPPAPKRRSGTSMN